MFNCTDIVFEFLPSLCSVCISDCFSECDFNCFDTSPRVYAYKIATSMILDGLY